MSQTFLDENPPMILDATCSYGRIWPAHATVRIDIRPETKPDFVMDNTNLNFPDAFFDEIYYDPPHTFRRTREGLAKLKAYRMRSGRLSPTFFERFGFWETRTDWITNLKGVNREFYRCLKPTGFLYAKIADSKNGVHLFEVETELFNFNITEDRTTKGKSNMGTSVVHWLTMRPKP